MMSEATLSFEEKSRRVLAVIYKMSNGMAGVPVNKLALLVEINRSGVMNMSAAEFEAYRRGSIVRAQAIRN